MLFRGFEAAVLTVVFVCSVAVVTVSADSAPLLISFSSRLSDKLIQEQEYQMSISWINTNQKKSYDGSLLIIVKSDGCTINCSDIIMMYDGVNIIAKVTGKSLQFQLPVQKFAPSTSGIISVEVQQKAVGIYYWDIGIVRS
jgi:hypothetical protein